MEGEKKNWTGRYCCGVNEWKREERAAELSGMEECRGAERRRGVKG